MVPRSFCGGAQRLPRIFDVRHIVTLYHRNKQNPAAGMVPGTFIFGVKAAPGSFTAKPIIKRISAVAEAINRDVWHVQPMLIAP